VTPYRDGIAEVAEMYFHGLGFGDPEWLDLRLRTAGERWGFPYAEEFDSWESPSRAATTLLPASLLHGATHPERQDVPRASDETGPSPSP
jgi:hypothetical protein